MQRWLVASAVLALVATAATTARAAAPRWVFFRDKDVAGREGELLGARANEISARALVRRQSARGGLGVDERDLAVSPRYIAGVEATGAHVRAVSRWLDAVSVDADGAAIFAIEALPYVRATQPVARRSRGPAEALPPGGGSATADLPPELFGVAFDQLALLSVPEMHDCGLKGAGVVVAVLDSGFLLTHQALSQLDVLAQHDFIHDDDVTADEPGDTPGQHDHGTSVLSLLAGLAPNSYIGAAPEISVILAKTEDISIEQPIEEDWFVEGLEWVESLGADLATASLGYTDWYEPSDFDGKTAVTTIAANVAMQNGLIMVAAAGNWGPNPATIGAPSDADGLIAVGAVDLTGTVTDFSSRGPTFDGRIKPDVSAPGKDDWVVIPSSPDAYTQGSGTSYATPLVAGVVALLKQAYPKLGPAEMHALLTSTATQAATPNNDIGYGIVQGYTAAGLYCTCHDADGDGFFDVACGGDDCDDTVAEVNPGAAEQCNGRDDDCDGALMRGEEDADADGSLACDDDCDDTDPAVHPGAKEDCDNGVDDDCDGAVDEAQAECAPTPPPKEDEPGGTAGSAAGEDDGGCGCRLDDRRGGDWAGLGWALAGLVAVARRRRQRPSDS